MNLLRYSVVEHILLPGTFDPMATGPVVIDCSIERSMMERNEHEASRRGKETLPMFMFLPNDDLISVHWMISANRLAAPMAFMPSTAYLEVSCH